MKRQSRIKQSGATLRQPAPAQRGAWEYWGAESHETEEPPLSAYSIPMAASLLSAFPPSDQLHTRVLFSGVFTRVATSGVATRSSLLCLINTCTQTRSAQISAPLSLFPSEKP